MNGTTGLPIAGLSTQEIALIIACLAFALLLIEISWVRRRKDLDHDLRLPFSEPPRADRKGARDVER